MQIKFTTPHEEQVFKTANYFTVFRHFGRNNRTRIECPTFEAAIAKAEEFGDKRSMIYAVNDFNFAHICNA
ncbi:MAG: hypothetical protein EBY38_02985 [Flavobacteriaceae bacterium]|nr:hypothetical protein [Flavobacteriaceae bacterium]